jgi:hypothetical protein
MSINRSSLMCVVALVVFTLALAAGPALAALGRAGGSASHLPLAFAASPFKGAGFKLEAASGSPDPTDSANVEVKRNGSDTGVLVIKKSGSYTITTANDDPNWSYSGGTASPDHAIAIASGASVSLKVVADSAGSKGTSATGGLALKPTTTAVPAIDLSDKAKLVLEVSGSATTLTAWGYRTDIETVSSRAGIHVPPTAELTVKGEGTLKAKNGISKEQTKKPGKPYQADSGQAAAIGGAASETSGRITFTGSVTVWAENSVWQSDSKSAPRYPGAAIIGGGAWANATEINILEHASVFAKANNCGNYPGAAIGSGSSASGTENDAGSKLDTIYPDSRVNDAGTITIDTDGVVLVKSGNQGDGPGLTPAGAAIGTGATQNGNRESRGTINIKSGTIYAKTLPNTESLPGNKFQGGSSAAIGSGASSNAGATYNMDINISGGTVIALGAWGRDSGAEDAAAIGRGSSAQATTVKGKTTISGGSVFALGQYGTGSSSGSGTLHSIAPEPVAADGSTAVYPAFVPQDGFGVSGALTIPRKSTTPSLAADYPLPLINLSSNTLGDAIPYAMAPYFNPQAPTSDKIAAIAWLPGATTGQVYTLGNASTTDRHGYIIGATVKVTVQPIKPGFSATRPITRATATQDLNHFSAASIGLSYKSANQDVSSSDVIGLSEDGPGVLTIKKPGSYTIKTSEGWASAWSASGGATAMQAKTGLKNANDHAVKITSGVKVNLRAEFSTDKTALSLIPSSAPAPGIDVGGFAAQPQASTKLTLEVAKPGFSTTSPTLITGSTNSGYAGISVNAPAALVVQGDGILQSSAQLSAAAIGGASAYPESDIATGTATTFQPGDLTFKGSVTVNASTGGPQSANTAATIGAGVPANNQQTLGGSIKILEQANLVADNNSPGLIGAAIGGATYRSHPNQDFGSILIDTTGYVVARVNKGQAAAIGGASNDQSAETKGHIEIKNGTVLASTVANVGGAAAAIGAGSIIPSAPLKNPYTYAIDTTISGGIVVAYNPQTSGPRGVGIGAARNDALNGVTKVTGKTVITGGNVYACGWRYDKGEVGPNSLGQQTPDGSSGTAFAGPTDGDGNLVYPVYVPASLSVNNQVKSTDGLSFQVGAAKAQASDGVAQGQANLLPGIPTAFQDLFTPPLDVNLDAGYSAVLWLPADGAGIAAPGSLTAFVVKDASGNAALGGDPGFVANVRASYDPDPKKTEGGNKGAVCDNILCFYTQAVGFALGFLWYPRANAQADATRKVLKVTGDLVLTTYNSDNSWIYSNGQANSAHAIEITGAQVNLTIVKDKTASTGGTVATGGVNLMPTVANVAAGFPGLELLNGAQLSLHLAEGAQLRATGYAGKPGVHVADPASLSVNAADDAATLTATGSGGAAGIGTGVGETTKSGTLSFNGGTVVATGSSDGVSSGAGIGSGVAAFATPTVSVGPITVNGGQILARSVAATHTGAGVGSGAALSPNLGTPKQPGDIVYPGFLESVTVNGGTLVAWAGDVSTTAGVSGAGVGTGGMASYPYPADAKPTMPKQRFLVNGGTLIARGGLTPAVTMNPIPNGAGIGYGGNLSGSMLFDTGPMVQNGGRVIAWTEVSDSKTYGIMAVPYQISGGSLYASNGNVKGLSVYDFKVTDGASKARVYPVYLPETLASSGEVRFAAAGTIPAGGLAQDYLAPLADLTDPTLGGQSGLSALGPALSAAGITLPSYTNDPLAALVWLPGQPNDPSRSSYALTYTDIELTAAPDENALVANVIDSGLLYDGGRNDSALKTSLNLVRENWLSLAGPDFTKPIDLNVSQYGLTQTSQNLTIATSNPTGYQLSLQTTGAGPSLEAIDPTHAGKAFQPSAAGSSLAADSWGYGLTQAPLNSGYGTSAEKLSAWAQPSSTAPVTLSYPHASPNSQAPRKHSLWTGVNLADLPPDAYTGKVLLTATVAP